MASVDTNILARWIVRDSQPQLIEVEKLFLNHAPLCVSPVALAELEHVLRHIYQFPRALIHGHFLSLLSSGYFDLSEALLMNTLTSYIEHPGLSFVDCWLTAEAQASAKTPLYTFDKKLAKQLEFADEPK